MKFICKIIAIIILFIGENSILSSQCGISGPGTNGRIVTCGQVESYQSSCNNGTWAVNGLDVRTGSNIYEGSIKIGRVQAIRGNRIQIRWYCITNCTSHIEISRGGQERFNPIIRVVNPNNCSSQCNDYDIVNNSGSEFNSGRVCFKSDCSAPVCVRYDVHFTDGVTSYNEQTTFDGNYTCHIHYGKRISSVTINEYYVGGCPTSNNITKDAILAKRDESMIEVSSIMRNQQNMKLMINSNISDNYAIQVIDIHGQKIYSNTIALNQPTMIKIPVESIRSGVLIVEVISSTERMVKKVYRF